MNLKDEIARYEKELLKLKGKIDAISDKNSENAKQLIEKYKNLDTYVKGLKGLADKLKEIKNKKYLPKNEKKKIKELIKEKRKIDKKYRAFLRDTNPSGRDFLSSLINQTDKKLHNFWYGEGKDEIQDAIKRKRWEKKKTEIRVRYAKGGLVSYVLPRALGLTAAAIVMPGFALAFGSAVATVATVGLGVYGTVVLAKTVSTIYNKIRYGSAPKFERQYQIRKGSFLDNVKHAWGKLFGKGKGKTNENSGPTINNPQVRDNDNSRNNDRQNTFDNSKKASEGLTTPSLNSPQKGDSITPKVPNGNKLDNNRGSSSASKPTNVQPSVSTTPLLSSPQKGDSIAPKAPNENKLDNSKGSSSVSKPANVQPSISQANEDLRNLDIRNIVNSGKKKNNGRFNFTFSDAVHLLRDKKNNYTDEQVKEALTVIAKSFNGKKVTEEDIRKTLTDYNKLEQLLSFYGSKVRSKDATDEDIETYRRLLGQFGRYNGDDYTINDFFADEAYYHVHPEEREDYEEKQGKGR